MTPQIIVHMSTTIDGRIDCPVVAQLGSDEYYKALASFEPSSKLTGRVTAAIECPAVIGEKPTKAVAELLPKQHHAAIDSNIYEIIVDTHGHLEWGSNNVDGNPVLVIMSQSTPAETLVDLNKKGISYIVTGKDQIDLLDAMETLYDSFGIERVAVVGGGCICGGFLAAGLVDEVSLVIGPGIDGRKGEASVFDGIVKSNNTPYRFHLKAVEKIGADTVWLRYHKPY